VPKYNIQQKIKTLAENAVNASEPQPSFQVEGIDFSHWEFNHRDGWLEDAWLAEYEVDATNIKEALNEFGNTLLKVIPRVSLVAQCYIEYLVEPFLVTRSDRDFGFGYIVKEDKPVGLMFMEDQKKALDLLVAESDLNNEFYLYWNDAVNTTGYTSKLLLMFATLLALAKKSKGDDVTLIQKQLGAKVGTFGTDTDTKVKELYRNSVV
jgi:hypothetical protein